jgi:hypothetical protein
VKNSAGYNYQYQLDSRGGGGDMIRQYGAICSWCQNGKIGYTYYSICCYSGILSFNYEMREIHENGKRLWSLG